MDGLVGKWQAYAGSKIEAWQVKDEGLDGKKLDDKLVIELDATGKADYGIKQKLENITPGTHMLTWKDLGRSSGAAGDNLYGVLVGDSKLSLNAPAQSKNVTARYLPSEPLAKNKWTSKAWAFNVTQKNIDDAKKAGGLWLAFVPRATINSYGALIGDVRLYPVEFKKMRETKNEANQIFNRTRKDDPAKNPLEPPDKKDNVSGHPTNVLYVVGRNTAAAGLGPSLCGVTLSLNLGGSTQFIAAAYVSGKKLPDSDIKITASGEVKMLLWPKEQEQEIRVGYDVNNNGELDALEVVPLNVPTKFDESAHGNPIVHTLSSGDYVVAGLEGAVIRLTPGMPGARNAFRLFYDGNMNAVDSPKPTPDTQRFDAFSSTYCEWLTHNAGTNFDATGVDPNFAVYDWDALSALGKVVGESYVIKKATRDFFNSTLLANVLSDMSRQATGSAAIDCGRHVIPHVHQGTTSFVPKTTVMFDDPGASNLIDDEFAAIGRGRLLNHDTRFVAQKIDVAVNIGSDEYPMYGTRTVIRVKAFLRGEVDDLYDFNYNAGGLSETGATLQLGYGNGAYGRTGGVIYLSRVHFDSEIVWDITP